MQSDGLAREVSELKGVLSGFADSVKRMEVSVNNLMSEQSTVAGILVKLESGVLKAHELENDIKQCNTTHKLAEDVIHRRIDVLTETVTANGNKFNGFQSTVSGSFRTLAALSVVLLGIAGYCVNWVIERGNGNKAVNVEQEYKLSNHSREIAELRAMIVASGK